MARSHRAEGSYPALAVQYSDSTHLIHSCFAQTGCKTLYIHSAIIHQVVITKYGDELKRVAAVDEGKALGIEWLLNHET